MFGAGMPLAAGPMFRNLGIGRGSSILGGVSCAFIPLPILLYKVSRGVREFLNKRQTLNLFIRAVRPVAEEQVEVCDVVEKRQHTPRRLRQIIIRTMLL